MTAALCDTNVVVKWFHDEPDDETPAARRIAGASEDGHVELKVLELTYYELGNTLRRLGASGAVIAGVLEALHEVCGPGIVMGRHHWAGVADVADRAGLSFYDAAYVAIADRHRLTLLTADKAMINAGGVLPSTYVETLGTP
jgi:predicted nucleic acid-binding protein